MTNVFETADLQQAEDVLRTAYGSLRIDTHGQLGGMRMEQVPLTPLARFDRNIIRMTLDVTGDPRGLLVFGHLRSGLARYGTNGSERSYRTGDVFLAVRPGQPHLDDLFQGVPAETGRGWPESVCDDRPRHPRYRTVRENR